MMAQDDAYDEEFEPVVKAVIRTDGPRKADVQPVAGFKRSGK